MPGFTNLGLDENFPNTWFPGQSQIELNSKILRGGRILKVKDIYKMLPVSFACRSDIGHIDKGAVE
jgi:hypothetical protein